MCCRMLSYTPCLYQSYHDSVLLILLTFSDHYVKGKVYLLVVSGAPELQAGSAVFCRASPQKQGEVDQTGILTQWARPVPVGGRRDSYCRGAAPPGLAAAGTLAPWPGRGGTGPGRWLGPWCRAAAGRGRTYLPPHEHRLEKCHSCEQQKHRAITN